MNGTATFASKVAGIVIAALAVAFGYGSLYATVARMESQLDRVVTQTIVNTAKMAEMGAKIDVLQTLQRRNDREYPWRRREEP